MRAQIGAGRYTQVGHEHIPLDIFLRTGSDSDPMVLLYKSSVTIWAFSVYQEFWGRTIPSVAELIGSIDRRLTNNQQSD